jgi:hypothetical protein
VPFDRPKLILLELENTTVPAPVLCVPAEMATPPPPPTALSMSVNVFAVIAFEMKSQAKIDRAEVPS